MPQTEERRKQYTNICVEVLRSFQEELKEAAKNKGLTRSEFVRLIISQYLNGGKKNDD